MRTLPDSTLIILPNARGIPNPHPSGPLREFHVSRKARLFYGFDEDLFTSTGNVVFPNFQAARRFAQKINEKRDVLRFPELTAYAHELNALGLFDELVHYLIDLYRQRVDPEVLEEAETFLREQIGEEALNTLLLRFVEEFPPMAVFKGKVTPEQYLQGQSEGLPHRQLVLEELLLLWLENENPAAEKYRDLFDDAPLETHPAYHNLIEGLHAFFRQKPPLGPHNESLIDLLEEPIRKAPESLPEQLNVLLEYAQPTLTPDWQFKILKELDLAREETRPRPPGPGPGEPELIVPEFPQLARTLWRASAGQEVLLEGEEAYTPDEDWMPQVVLIAKNVLVWLDQLTRFYARPITRLDEIPDEELDRLAAYGFTGLWLIGVWERSPASRKIKHLRGNTDAEASAYSVYDYVIARRLGGEAAYEDLRQRCQKRGIRLACDMVPNHTGLDARWVAEHPDWYMSVNEPPFPTYSYTGPDLSSHRHIGIWIEDHYWDATDAAVVFKREDFRSGDVRYIYHGNDGTSIPWNDTAQLNHLKEEVREALIQAILNVAQKFPIIRFDAAMTLTKYHYQRLWFPEPGSAGAIPSRAEFSMTREEFDRYMPREFWREVVDRVTEEAPDTLLIAEAFWLMEGYFVRTLGMHRVYNSAFMNMLKREENAKFLKLIQNTLEFDPEILKRYVNYMSNPDEEPAVVQFGKGDKYFGVCTLLVTMPGLPMFAHGQIEGFAEKYGMEFARAYWNETPDEALIQRHKREIFPLMKKRSLFADVAHFRVYPLLQGADVTDPHVITFTNRHGDERALVIFHNRFASTRGNLHTSFPVRDKATDTLRTGTLAEELGLSTDKHTFTIFREHVSGLEYLYRNAHLHEFGLPLTLHAYEYRVYLEFEEVEDETGAYAELHTHLAGRGVPSIREALRNLRYLPLHDALQTCWNTQLFTHFLRPSPDEGFPMEELTEGVSTFLKEATRLLEKTPGSTPTQEEIASFVHLLYEEIPDAPAMWAPSPALGAFLEEALSHRGFYRTALWGWYLLHVLHTHLLAGESAAEVLALADEWLLTRKMAEALPPSLFSEDERTRLINLIRALLVVHEYLHTPHPFLPSADAALRHLLRQPEVQALLNVHRYQETLWFSKEGMESMLAGIALLLRLCSIPFSSHWLSCVDTWYAAAEESAYQVETWLKLVSRKALSSETSEDATDEETETSPSSDTHHE